jgi:hypothetical protein
MSDTALTSLFAPAPTKANAQGQDVTETAKPKRTRTTKAERIIEAVAADNKVQRKRRTRKAVDDQAILKACMKKLRQAQDPGRVVATLRIMFE